jgi:hypothetical protein
MRIGLDFDNTIVNYDQVFHLVAREGGHIPADVPRTKLNVRDYLRDIGREPVWPEMQGYVYGARMSDASAYPGALAFMRWARDAGHELRIISHKTQYPFLGKKYDLHKSARGWVEAVLNADGKPLVEPEHAFFELTKEAKLRRIQEQGCGIFIDDLPEILLAPDFPSEVIPILFDPERHHTGRTALATIGSWDDLRAQTEAACAIKN